MKIEQDIPCPPRMAMTVWPFKDMKVGDSFLIPTNMNRRAGNAGSSYQRSHPGVKFAIRKVGDEWRMWRVS